MREKSRMGSESPCDVTKSFNAEYLSTATIPANWVKLKELEM